MKKTVFIFSPVQVYPAIGANQQDIAGHVELFKELGCAIVLFYFEQPISDPENDIQAENEHDIKIIELKKGVPCENNKYTLWYQVNSHCPHSAIDRINREIENQKPGILFFEYARFAYLATKLNKGGARVIFRSHNFELMHYYEKELLNAKLNGVSYPKFLKNNYHILSSIYQNEKLMHQIADRVFSISNSDSQSFRRLYRSKKTKTLYPYLDKLDFRHEVNPDKEVLDVLYMGSNFNNHINKTGADYLINKIIPLVNKHLKEKFRFHITGKYAEEKLSNNGHDNIVIHGFVDDYHDFLKTMDLCCIPVSEGRGTKVKMFESLKAGIPTVGFTNTFRGIPYSPGCWETAETPVDFMIALQKLLIPELRREISDRAFEYIEEIASKVSLLQILSEELT